MPRMPSLHDQGSHSTFLLWLEFPGEAVQVVTEALTWEREALGSWLGAERPGLPRAAQQEWALAVLPQPARLRHWPQRGSRTASTVLLGLGLATRSHGRTSARLWHHGAQVQFFPSLPPCHLGPPLVFSPGFLCILAQN